MRIIFILLLTCLTKQNLTAQVESPRKQLPQKEVKEGQSSKKQIQAEMLSAINELNTQVADLENQLAKAIKNKDDEETIKDLRDQIAMLKKQVEMMGGLGKTVSGISEKTFHQAGEDEAIVPKKDAARINRLPKKIFSDVELIPYLKTVVTDVEKLIPLAEKTEALKIYNEIELKDRSLNTTSNVASGAWVFGHQAKAAFIMGRACLDDPGDPDILNNYAAFLIMAGAEEKALPILEYLNKKYPENSTILNNMGQAWFGLGEMANAKKYLEDATSQYENHSQANLTLSQIYLVQTPPDAPHAILCLKKSLKESFTTEKEGYITALGGTVDEDDISWDLPWEEDPFGSNMLLDIQPVFVKKHGDIARGREALNLLTDAIEKEKARLEALKKQQQAKVEAFHKKMETDKPYAQKKLKSKNIHYKKTKFKRIARDNSPVNGTVAVAKQIQDYSAEWGRKSQKLRYDMQDQINSIEKQYEPCTKPTANCPGGWQEEKCNKIKDAEASFMGKAAVLVHENYQWQRNYYKSFHEAVTNYSKFEAIDETVWDLSVTSEEIALLSILESIHRNVVMGYDVVGRCGLGSYTSVEAPQLTITMPSKCEYYRKINFLVGQLELKCNEQTLFDGSLKYKGENSQQGSVEMGPNSPGSKSKGPLQAGGNDPAASSLEITPSGIGEIKGYGKSDRGRPQNSQPNHPVNNDRMSWNAGNSYSSHLVPGTRFLSR